MKVADLIEQLREQDPEAEVHFCTSCGSGPLGAVTTTEADELRAYTAVYGLLLLPEKQKHVNIVVLDSSSCGL